jgi:transcriptional regulator with XRE-family HTH domain
MKRWPWYEPLNYREASPRARRVLEIRAAVGFAARRLRERRQLTQAEVASLADSTQDRISKLERTSGHVTLDFAVHVLVVLDATDDEILAAFDPRNVPAIREMRRRASGAYYPRPAEPAQGDYHAHPRSRSQALPRVRKPEGGEEA